MTPRRVLMTADAVGGVWTYSVELARGLSQRGVATVLAVMGRAPSAGQRAAAAAVSGLTLLHAPFRLEWEAGCEADLAASADWLLGLERRFAADVVHVNGFWHASLPFVAPRLLAAHSCVNTWWRAVHGEAPPAEWRGYDARVRQGLAAAELVVAPSHAFKATLEEAHGPLPRARVIWNGRSAQAFGPGAKEPLVFASGRLWDAAKNVDAVIAVAPALPWPVAIAGETRPDAAKANVLRLGLLEPDEIAQWLGRAAIFALPARYEPFGLGPLEAALAGCALVLGDIPSLRELWDGAALFVPSDDRAALQRAILALIDDAALLRRMGEAAGERARRYTAERMTDAYLGTYSGLLDRAAPNALKRAS